MLKAFSLVLLLTAACGGTDDSPVERASSAPAVAVTPTQAPTVNGDWRARVQADVAALKAENPSLYAELMALAPSKTRAGHLRFTSTPSADPRATSVLIDRLLRGASEDERAALIEALPRTRGMYADALVELLTAEPVASVRAVYVHAAKRAPADHALRVLQRGLADSSPEVQAEAARVAAGHAAGPHVAGELRAALGSSDATTRAEAARALGILGVEAARGELVGKLGDAEADVRLEALRALDRLAPGSVTPGTLSTLSRDADPRVARLAAKLSDAAVVR